MQANWSLILNVLLLIVVITAIGRVMKARKQSFTKEQYQPPVVKVETSPYDVKNYNDDIIAVRKVKMEISPGLDQENTSEPLLFNKPITESSKPRLMSQEEQRMGVKAESGMGSKLKIEVTPRIEKKIESRMEPKPDSSCSLVLFLLAKEKRQFAGYELLQTLLASGLRFGEGNLFHRHQFFNGQGPVICSLASATATGVFDLQNIGALSVHGLCLFMSASNNPTIDAERFAIMLETAKQLSEGLDAYLLDDARKPLTQEGILRYYGLLNIVEPELMSAVV